VPKADYGVEDKLSLKVGAIQ